MRIALGVAAAAETGSAKHEFVSADDTSGYLGPKFAAPDSDDPIWESSAEEARVAFGVLYPVWEVHRTYAGQPESLLHALIESLDFPVRRVTWEIDYPGTVGYQYFVVRMT
jgi:hypothetical protein